MYSYYQILLELYEYTSRFKFLSFRQGFKLGSNVMQATNEHVKLLAPNVIVVPLDCYAENAAVWG